MFSDLDEYAIAGLRGDPVDGFGVGTSVVTGSGAPTASMVYKLNPLQALYLQPDTRNNNVTCENRYT